MLTSVFNLIIKRTLYDTRVLYDKNNDHYVLVLSDSGGRCVIVPSQNENEVNTYLKYFEVYV